MVSPSENCHVRQLSVEKLILVKGSQGSFNLPSLDVNFCDTVSCRIGSESPFLRREEEPREVPFATVLENSCLTG